MFVDAHCHLERETYGDELPQVMHRARARGLAYFIAVGASRVSGGAIEAVALATQHAEVFAAVGIHPHDAAAADDTHCAVIDQLLSSEQVVALGEVGLDYYYDNAPREQQRQVFRRFLTMARKHNKPVMLHIRDAHRDCWEDLDAVGLPEAGGVVHCFTAGVAEAEAYLSRGLYLSIPGVVTFKNALPLREAVGVIPQDRMLIETDCPYLAPVPHRGKRNEPAFVVDTAAAIAALRGISADEVGVMTTANAIRLFALPKLSEPD